MATLELETAVTDILDGLPSRIHEVMDRHVAATPDRVALIDDGGALTYRELDRAVSGTADALRTLGIRAGDRVMIVSENCIALACLLIAVFRLDAWAIVANPRLSPRELDQIRDHSGARRAFFTADVSQEAAAHALRYGAPVQNVGPFSGIGVSPLNENTATEPVEADGARQVAVLIYTSGTTDAEKRHAYPPQSAVQRQDDGCATRHDASRRAILRAADLPHRRNFAAHHDLDGRREGSPCREI
jgi:acyl-CoA synthetase (AMP-forming)/AMP-acid ligase II